MPELYGIIGNHDRLASTGYVPPTMRVDATLTKYTSENVSPAVARLFKRLTAFATSAMAVAGSQRLTAQAPIPQQSTASDGGEFRNNSRIATPKLVYGAARRGARQLASHSSHSSHASHTSHYSGSGGDPGYSPAAPSNPPDQAPQPPPPTPSQPDQSSRQASAQVLKKLPKIRSRWPKTILLIKDTFFTIYDGGKVVGIVSLKAGTTLTLVEVKAEHAVVVVSSTTSPVPVENTDLIERLGGADTILALPDDPEPKPPEPKPGTQESVPAPSNNQPAG